MLLIKTPDISNVASADTGLKTVVLPSAREAPVVNKMDTVQVLHTTNQLEDFQATRSTSTEEKLVQVEEITENVEVESGKSKSVKQS